MESQIDWYTARALYEWQAELGATEAILDAPVNRYELKQNQKPVPKSGIKAPTAPIKELSPVDIAQKLAAAASDLSALCSTVENFDLCDLRKGARNAVFYQGSPAARVMVIGDAPSRADDEAGHPFAGREGALFDKMFDAIGYSRQPSAPANGLYLANLFPWNSPRTPTPVEVAMMLPFLKRHITLAAPEVVVVMGTLACRSLLSASSLAAARGAWSTVEDRPALAIFPPQFLLQDPIAKRAAWQDLLMLKQRLDG